MYELITGKHPLYNRGEDKQTYKDKLKNLRQLDFSDSQLSKFSIHLIQKLCEIKPSARYKLD